MKWWQLFFLMSGIYVAPHMNYGLAVACGLVMLVSGFIALLKGD